MLHLIPMTNIHCGGIESAVGTLLISVTGNGYKQKKKESKNQNLIM